MRLFCHGLLWIGIIGLGSIGCEPHTFEKTKQLHGGHGDHGDGHGHGDHAEGEHHEDHAEDDHQGDEAKPKAEEKKAKAEKKTEEPRDVGL